MRTAVGVLAIVPLLAAAEAGVDEFLQRFTDEWMRFHTDLAASTRYFSGPEQDAFERRIAPSVTPEYKRAELELIRKGLAELRKFDRARMTDAQRKSAEIVAEDLQQQLEAERYEDFYFPFYTARRPRIPACAVGGDSPCQHPAGCRELCGAPRSARRA